MKIRFLKNCQSALGSFKKDQVVDMREKEARSLIGCELAIAGEAFVVVPEVVRAPAPKAEA